ncbi:complement C1q tumor necrosis factor-related protein 2-like [Daphnia pulex]|uniref:complement C1q tumor necrosis factor-related protein 2-like n=1 Tax=Daphnia pulex TaxID=6669 RepID=UPI001EDE117E|nr:complement C1q tumor necrosis factor-related protein 2-like [Daphnia pulex]
MPSSCADLQGIGHKLSGFFSVKGAKKMEMVYCNFNANQNDIQKWIGYVDVKSAPVHFYVQRNSSFFREKTPIPFELAVVNEGNAMNLTSGIFTAPKPGIYFFSFKGLAFLKSSSYAELTSYLYFNGNRIGSSYVDHQNKSVNQWSPVTLQSTLNLKKGDQVWVTINHYGSPSYLHEDDHRYTRYTHFMGWMSEEEIVAAL